MPARPLVAAIGTGGTISSLGRDSTDVLDYPDFGIKLPIEEVVGRYPEIAGIAEVLPIPFRSVGSTAIGRPSGWSLPGSFIGLPPKNRLSRAS
jgi:L-asparaginase